MVGDPEMYCDGWRIHEDREFRLRVHPAHVQVCKDAIRKRWANESQHTLATNSKVDLTVVPIRAKVNK